MHLLEATLLVLLGPAALQPADVPADAAINPVPRAVLAETLHQWTFDQGDEGWVAEHECALSAGGGLLKIQSTGNDPFFHRAVDFHGGHLALKMKVRSRTAGAGTVYWTTNEAPNRGEDKVARFQLKHDGQWQETTARFLAPGRLTDLRIDPGSGPGEFDVDWIRLIHEEPHPLTIEAVEVLARQARFTVKNHRSEPLEFSADGQTHSVEGGATVLINRPVRGDRPLEPVTVELLPKNLPPVRRTIFLHHPTKQTDWIARPLGDCSMQIARDGSVARIQREGMPVALIGPLVHLSGKLPALKLVDDAPTIRFQGQGITLSMAITGKEIRVSIDSQQPCEGPVVRSLGGLEQGLLAGLEYLGQGRRVRRSSTSRPPNTSASPPTR